MPKTDEIFKLFTEVKSLSARAQNLELYEIQAVLNYVSDRLVHEYYRHAGDSAQEVQELDWNMENWPSATAVLLEMKSMILAMERAEQPETKPSVECE